MEAKNLRGVLKAMDALYPGLGEHLEEETTVAINGEMHETGYFQPVPPGAEVFFIPKIVLMPFHPFRSLKDLAPNEGVSSTNSLPLMQPKEQ